MRIVAEPLTAEAFAPFGQVLEAPRPEPRQDRAGRLDNRRAAAVANLALVRAAPATLPMRVVKLERHPYSSQAFAPLDAAGYLVLVCPSDGEGKPRIDGLRAFVAAGHQGINYDANVWHHGMAALERPGTFAMLVHEDGSAGDTEFIDVEGEVTVTAPGA
jgi:ureidoglycolate lyase